jgi:tetratricopeptide (TPR) repeat protein
MIRQFAGCAQSQEPAGKGPVTILLMKVWPLAQWFLAVAVVVSAQGPPVPSSGPSPQALTQEEFDDWLDLLESPDPRATVGLANEFLARYPRSAFIAGAYQAQMLAYEQLDNYQAALDAGRKALHLSPGNLHVLAALANLLPLGVAPDKSDDPRLDEAETYARRLLARLPETPGTISTGDWKRARLRLEVSAHSALGLVFCARSQPQAAIREFEWVTNRSPEADGVQYLRLGSAYTMVKDFCAAFRAFERAVTLGPEQVRQRARQGKQNLASLLSGCPSER